MTLEGGLTLRPLRAAVLLAALLAVIGPVLPATATSVGSASARASSHEVVAIAGGIRSIVTLGGFAPAEAPHDTASGSADPGAQAAAVAVEHARVLHLDATVSGLESRLGFRAQSQFRYALQGFVATLSAGQRAALSADPRVTAITPVRAVRIAGGAVPDGVARVHAQPVSNGGPKPPVMSGVNVAVLDTGIRFIKHDPDLNVNSKGIDCADDAKSGGTGHGAWSEVDTHNGHGTHVAGTIGAKGADVYGVAPGVRLFSVRVFANHNGRIVGDTATVACGLDWVAATHSAVPPTGSRPIDVANMSIQGPRDNDDPTDCPKSSKQLADAEHQASCVVSRLGVTIVAAAGNSGKDVSTSVPAAWSDTIAVGAIADFDGKAGSHAADSCSESDDAFASFSNHGDGVELVAPGVCVLSLGVTVGSTRVMSGTSMAAPHVTGAAARLVALLRSRGQSASPPDVRRALHASANLDWDAQSDPDSVAHRLLDVAAAEASTTAVAAWVLPSVVALTSDVTSMSVQLQVQRRGLYPGDVNLQADAPAGMVVDLMPRTASTSDDPPLRGLGDSGTLRTIRIAANGIADGRYTVTVRAIRAGHSSADPHATITIPVTVDTRPPTITRFGATFVTGATAGDAQPLALSWSGHDAGTGIVGYTLQRDNGDGWEDISPFPATATSTVTLAPLKRNTGFRLQARDGAGNTSAWAMLTVHTGLRDSNKKAITYAGPTSWKTRTDDAAFGDSIRRSKTPGAFAITAFNGAAVSLIAPTGPNLGQALVSIDGGPGATVDLATPKSHERRVVFSADGLSAGSHTIEVKVSSGIVDIDAFEFLGVIGE